MVFSSHIFIYYFLPLFLAFYFSVPRKGKSLVIALFSYVFYGWWRPDFVLLMLFSTVVDHHCGKRIRKEQGEDRSGKRWVVLSCFVNLGLLGYFKYANFGIDTFNLILQEMGHSPVEWAKIVLPVGISFYTFQTMSYTIDVYRKDAPPVKSFTDFMCYVALFPQLVAGPIVRYRSVAEQLHSRSHTLSKIFQGVLLLQIGFAKKLLLADNVGPLADAAFAAEHLATIDAWIGILAYAFQIYFDFSGYSDMAIGLGLIMGFRFPINFDQPYRSASITEFWRRWHISLSAWLRDYLYIPLGGNKKGVLRTYFNLAATMLLGGLWHGANWTFICWGGFQGFWLIVERLSGKRTLYGFLPRAGTIAVTFVIALFGWVFFRATNVSQAIDYMQSMVVPSGGLHITLAGTNLHYLCLLLAGIVVWTCPTSQAIAERPQPGLVLAIQPLFLMSLAQIHFMSHIPFLYFQF